MDDYEAERSGVETAAKAAQIAKSIARIAKAAASSGFYGAAAAAAKEALPFLIKVALWIIATVILLHLVVIVAIPSMFFGFQSSGTADIADMTDQAMSIGRTFMSLEDYESTQVDTIVTSIVSKYEEEGTQIDDIVVVNSFSKEDVAWLVSISSVDYRQDLSAMSSDAILALCSTHITYRPTLLTGEKTVLKIVFNPVDPDKLMRDLGFDEAACNWAKIIHETLEESDALTKYASYFDGYRPSYSGDTAGGSGYQHGDAYDNTIDISRFVSPHTKNNRDLVAYVLQAYENNWGYVYGTYGHVLTQSLFNYKLRQYPDGVGNHAAFIRSNWLGRRTADCIGLIKGYGWLDPDTLSIKYGTNGMPDVGANTMFRLAKQNGAANGSIGTLPETPGLALWKDGHIGVYVGNGYAVEAMGTRYGVVKTKVSDRNWVNWFEIPYITYLEG